MKHFAGKAARIFVTIFVTAAQKYLHGRLLVKLGLVVTGAALWAASPLVPLSIKPAYACESCGCVSSAHSYLRSVIRQQHDMTRQHVINEFDRHRQDFWLGYYFRHHIQAAMMMMTEQLTAAAMKQMFIIGTFFDAKEMMETQRLYAQMTARAHKDYQPSTSFCEIGTMALSLGASQHKADYTALVMAESNITRQQGSLYHSSGGGPGGDKAGRIRTFINRFCDIGDHNAGLINLCRTGAGGGESAPPLTRQQDVDYGRMIDHRHSVAIDLGNNAIGGVGCQVTGTPYLDCDQPGIMALSTNLYANQVFEYIPETLFSNEGNHGLYMHVRAIQAKRSVAQNSFNNIVGMKSAGSNTGSAHTAQYMQTIFRQLGVDDTDEIHQIIGERPSYHAQMEMLTKKLYQRPDFYTNLYDKPANVDRKEAALRAIGLMQNMDRFKSQMRSEMLMSLILEIEVAKYQRKIDNRHASPPVEGRRRDQGGD